MNRNFRIAAALLAVLFAAPALGGCTGGQAQETAAQPEETVIPFPAGLETVGDEYGADAYDHALDHADSPYFAAPDYFHMESGGSLHILPGFETYQQTTEYSCGCASALMVLHRFGVDEYDELDLARLMETDTSTGTSVEGLAAFFEQAGFAVESHAGTDFFLRISTRRRRICWRASTPGSP